MKILSILTFFSLSFNIASAGGEAQVQCFQSPFFEWEASYIAPIEEGEMLAAESAPTGNFGDIFGGFEFYRISVKPTDNFFIREVRMVQVFFHLEAWAVLCKIVDGQCGEDFWANIGWNDQNYCALYNLQPVSRF